mgnify:CR=1 FL=1
MKPFDIEQAKAGKPVQTRDGRDARIICFDAKRKDCHIVCLITCLEDGMEYLFSYFRDDGKWHSSQESTHDLFMKSEIKEGWVIALKNSKLSSSIYNTKEEAEFCSQRYPSFVAVAKIEWEE